MSVFVDTSAFYALVDADDDKHARAVATWQALADENEPVLTHNLVLVESIALVQARMGIRALLDLVPFLNSADITWIGPTEHDAVLAALIASRRQPISFIDHASFHVMRRDGVRRAFAYDRHFTQEGFEVV